MRKYRILHSLVIPGKNPTLYSQIVEADTMRYNQNSYQYEFINGTGDSQFIVAYAPSVTVLSVTREN